MSVNNVKKLLWYANCVTKSPIIIDGEELDFTERAYKLGTKFFYEDGCTQCGICCIPEHPTYTQSEYDKILTTDENEFIKYDIDPKYLNQLKNSIKIIEHNINGQTVNFYVDTNDFPTEQVQYKLKKTCPYLFKDNDNWRCGVHPCRSITCAMPHIRFQPYKNKNVTFNTMQYGRNWALGCVVKFKPPTEENFESLKQSRIEKFQHLKQVFDDMNIDTYLPEIIDYIAETDFNNHKNRLCTSIIDAKHTKNLILLEG